MIVDAEDARARWADRISVQVEQLLAVAMASSTEAMREELLDYACRLEDHAAHVRARP